MLMSFLFREGLARGKDEYRNLRCNPTSVTKIPVFLRLAPKTGMTVGLGWAVRFARFQRTLLNSETWC